MVAKALAKVLSREDIVQHLDGSDLSDELVNSLRSAIRLREMQSAVADLREKTATGRSGRASLPGLVSDSFVGIR